MPPSRSTSDLVVVGGGVVGLQIARTFRRRHPDARVRVLEKEDRCGAHASGRNSGVLHAGFYYSADSLKARFSRDGAAAMAAYCEARGLPLNRCGKLVVARSPAEHAGLDTLLERARANGVELHPVDEDAAKEIEPRVKTAGRALWSPNTATVDPEAVMRALVEDARAEGVEVSTGCAYRGRVEATGDAVRVRTDAGELSCGLLVNAAGLYADRVAADFGFGGRYRILPFKGLYLYSDRPAGELRTCVYPVPDLANPFLGVHFTVTVDGRAKIGPTATPAFWREHYGGLEGLRLDELAEVVGTELSLLVRAGFDFRGLAWREVGKYWRPNLVRRAGELLEGVRVEDYRSWGRPGIRAQLLDLETRRLEMDFVVEGDARSLHVLNAISPAFTCSIPFAEYCCDRLDAGGAAP